MSTENTQSPIQEPNKEFESKYTYEATLRRLDNINELVLADCKNHSIAYIYSQFVQILGEKCRQNKEKLDNQSYEKLWTNTVYRNCVQFRNDNFPLFQQQKDESKPDISDATLNYFNTEHLAAILQFFNDYTRIKYQKSINDYENGNNNSNSKDEQGNYKHQMKNKMLINKKLNTNFVDLYYKCLGIWRKKKVNKNRQPIN
jgi:hypothetical protein